MNNLRRIFLLLAAVITLTGCEKTKERFVIAVIPRVNDQTVKKAKWAAINKGEELGIHVRWDESRQATAQSQQAVIQQLIRAGNVKGILISCFDAVAAKEMIREAVDAGIVVATFDSDSPASKRSFFIGSDNEKAGAEAAKLIRQYTAETGRTANHIGLFAGFANGQTQVDRLKGFYTEIPQADVDDVWYSDEVTATALTNIDEYLDDNDQTNGVVFLSSLTVMDDPSKITLLDMMARDEGPVVFFDYSEKILDFILEKPYVAAIKQDYVRMTEQGVEMLYALIQGRQVPESTTTDITIITKENAAEELSDFREE